MATGQPTLRVLSIGCSCINRFQFNFFVERHPDLAPVFPRGLFDWNIASLEATLLVLRHAADGSLERILKDDHKFHVAWDALILHRELPSFSFFHEETPHDLLADPDRRSDFVGKLLYLAQPFVTPPGIRTHLVWSNLQPNLPATVDNVIPWGEFNLTERRYDTAKSLGRRLFGAETTYSFLSTPQDIETSLTAQQDVHVINLPRGEAYEGDPFLYDEILKAAIQT